MEIHWLAIAENRFYQIHIYRSFHHGFPHIMFFFPWTVKQLVAHSVSLVRVGWLEDWVGLLLTCQHPSTPQLSAVPCSSWPGCLSAALTGEGGRRWIRGMTKISPALTPLWVARHCHAASERAITVTFSHFKAHKQVLYPWSWCTLLILRARFYISLRVFMEWGSFLFYLSSSDFNYMPVY